MSLPSLSIRRPVTTLMFYIGIVMLGVIAFQNLAVDFLPPIRIPRLIVQTSFPNVSPEEIENTVSQPIESALSTVTGTKKVSSVSKEGTSLVSVEFYWGTNMDFAMLGVREKLDQLRAALPREAGRPTILKVDPATEPIMTIAVSEKGIATPAAQAASDGRGRSPASWIPLAQRDSEKRNSLPANARSSSPEARPLDLPAGMSLPANVRSSHAAFDSELGSESLVELKETARALIKRRIEQIDGVAQTAVLGGLEREIQVDLDTRKLQALGLSLDQVSQALANANLNLPGGTLKQGLFRFSLRTLGEFTKAAEIRDVVVARTAVGGTITIRDLGTVRDAFKERIGLTRYNGNEIIALQVRKEAGANTVEVSRRVHEVLDQLRSEYPNLRLDVISDQAEFISKSIADVEQAILIGAILAFLVLFFFLRRAKYPLIIGLTMPISILATFIAMYFLGINLNIISLTGLALGIGMLGDNAIIVVENVTRLREKGLGLIEAAVEGAQEINLAVTASTLTNVAIFLPIIFVEGVASQLFKDMGVTMTISLLVSLLVAATLVPMLVSREASLKAKRQSISDYILQQRSVHRSIIRKILFWLTLPLRLLVVGIVSLAGFLLRSARSTAAKLAPGFYRLVDAVSLRAYDVTDRFLARALQRRGRIIGGTILLFALCVVLAFFIPSEPAPDLDQTRFSVQVFMPKGTTLEGTSSLVRQLEKEFLAIADVRGVYSTIGITEESNFWSASEAAIERGELEVRVSSEGNTNEAINRVRNRLTVLRSSLTGVEFVLKKRGTTFEQILRSETNDIKVRVMGRDPQVAADLAEQFSDRLVKIEGMTDLRSSLQRGSPEYQLVVDRERASRYGLSVQAVAQHIASQVRGKEATYLSDFDRKVTIRVQPRVDQRNDLEKVLASIVHTGNLTVPVRELVSWERTEGYAEIWRENQQRAVLLTANVSGRSIGSVVKDIQASASTISLPAGYSISVGGENEEIRESFRSLFIIIILSLFLVYMILAAEYESILYPFVILLTSPLAFIGAILAMWLTGQHYNVMSLIGLVIMIGAVDNDAVIAVDVMTGLRREGRGVNDAIREGIRLRLRPILMTTATTVLGIIPLVFEFGTGSELVRALTAPLVGGLIASTVFTVVAIPIVYSYVDKWAIGRKTLDNFNV